MKTADEIVQYKQVLIEEINLRSEDEIESLFSQDIEQLEVLRDSLPDAPEPDSDAYRARIDRLVVRERPTTGGVAPKPARNQGEACIGPLWGYVYA